MLFDGLSLRLSFVFKHSSHFIYDTEPLGQEMTTQVGGLFLLLLFARMYQKNITTIFSQQKQVTRANTSVLENETEGRILGSSRQLLRS